MSQISTVAAIWWVGGATAQSLLIAGTKDAITYDGIPYLSTGSSPGCFFFLSHLLASLPSGGCAHSTPWHGSLPSVLFLIQLPTDILGKAADNRPRIWVPAINTGDQDGIPCSGLVQYWLLWLLRVESELAGRAFSLPRVHIPTLFSLHYCCFSNKQKNLLQKHCEKNKVGRG